MHIRICRTCPQNRSFSNRSITHIDELFRLEGGAPFLPACELFVSLVHVKAIRFGGPWLTAKAATSHDLGFPIQPQDMGIWVLPCSSQPVTASSSQLPACRANMAEMDGCRCPWTEWRAAEKKEERGVDPFTTTSVLVPSTDYIILYTTETSDP